MTNGIEALKSGIRYMSILLSMLLFMAWSKYETDNWDSSRLSCRVWSAIVIAMIIGAFIWAWL